MTDRRTVMAPLTDEWIRAQIVSGTIVPPRDHRPDSFGAWFRLSLWAVAICLAFVPWFFVGR